jgi:hypothetical protein
MTYAPGSADAFLQSVAEVLGGELQDKRGARQALRVFGHGGRPRLTLGNLLFDELQRGQCRFDAPREANACDGSSSARVMAFWHASIVSLTRSFCLSSNCIASIAVPFQMSAAKLQMVWQRLASCTARRLASPRRRGPNVARTIGADPARRDPAEVPFPKNCGESRN